MDDNKKRIIAIIGFVVVTILLGYLIYWVFFYTPSKDITRVTSTPTGKPGEFPTTREGKGITPSITTLGELPSTDIIPSVATPTETRPIKGVAPVNQAVDTYALNPTKDTLGQVKFYNELDGKFYRLMRDGSIKEMSDQVFYNVKKTTWSPTENEIIIEYPDGSNIYYNFDNRKQVTLPKHWEEFSFAPQGNQIAAKSLGLSVENRWLISSNPDGTSIKLIEPLGQNSDRVSVDWSPNQQIVALSRTGDSFGADREEILFVGLHGENFKSTIVEGRGIKSQWSPTGEQLLYSVYNSRSDFKPEIWLVNASGDQIGSNRKLLNLNTWADKCTFDSERFIYCAVPTELQSGAGFAPSLSNNTPDKIFKIDTRTNLKVEIPITDSYTVDEIFIGEDGSALFFTDKNKAGLFNINL